MNAQLEQPATREDLVADLARTEALIISKTREMNLASGAIPGLLAAGNKAGAEQARADARGLATQIDEFQENAEQLREALKLLVAQERTTSNAKAGGKLIKALGDLKTEVADLEAKRQAYADQLGHVSTCVDSVYAQCRSAGVTPDPYALQATFWPTELLAMHLATEGKIGRANTVENFHQLRTNGRASVANLTATFCTLTERLIRGTFGMRS